MHQTVRFPEMLEWKTSRTMLAINRTGKAINSPIIKKAENTPMLVVSAFDDSHSGGSMIIT